MVLKRTPQLPHVFAHHRLPKSVVCCDTWLVQQQRNPKCFFFDGKWGRTSKLDQTYNTQALSPSSRSPSKCTLLYRQWKIDKVYLHVQERSIMQQK